MDHERTSPTLTFLFTDVEGSTQRWERSPDAMRLSLERHDALLHAAVSGSGGRVVKSTGDGVMAVFDAAGSALAAALEAQRRLAAEHWGDGGPLRVRMGVHSGEVQVRDHDYFGRTVNRAARIMAAGHGGQVLVSSAAAELAADELPDGSTLLDLGSHRLKDLERPEHLFQLAAEGLADQFPPVRTLSSRPNNLPVEVSTFVGRTAELTTITARLASDEVRLVTLTGPGGTGKTRLALRVAAELVDHYDDGVFLVELAEVADADEVAATVARALGLAETSDRPAVETLRTYLEHRRLLLVLDNFEQVTAAAPVVVDLLQHSPGLTLLVTSRQALRVRGEHVFPVPPLNLPATGGTRVQDLAGSEAVQLFVDRAQQVRPEFTLSAENAALVAEICRRLDGLPLAIELATARLSLFTPQALLDRLSDRLGVLRAGAHDLPARQQTLRDTIDWSYHLLDPGQRRLFELLSVFSGADVDALDRVAAALPPTCGVPPDVLDTLTSLVEMSLVRRSDEGALRVSMLETIREFAAERLRSRPDAADEVRRAHATYFADLAERRRADLSGPHPEAALTEVVADLDNLRTAWRHWVAAGDVARLDQLIHTLWLVADALGRYQLTVELTTDLLRVLAALPDGPDREAREMTLRTTVARALLAIKGFAPEVDHAYALALDLFDRHQLPPLFPVLRSLASHCTTSGDKTRGVQLGQEILRLADREDNPSIRVDGHLIVAANVAFGEPEEGLRHLDEAIRLYRSRPYDPGPYRTGVNPGVSTLTTAALLHCALGRPDTGRAHADRAVALAIELDRPYTLAYALFHSAYLHLWRREPDRVWDRATELLDLVAAHDFVVWKAVGTCLLGAAQSGRGDPDRGLRLLDEGIGLYRRVASPPVFWPMLLQLAAAGRLEAGRAGEGLVLLDEALGFLDQPPPNTLVAETYLLKGDLILAHPDPDGDAAQPWFQRAYDAAESFGLATTSVRAALRMARLRRDGDAGQQALRQLQTAYDRLTEGLDLPDAAEAREAMQRLETSL